jgi:HlyD family secretion protein
MTAISKPALGLIALAVLGGAAWYLWPAPAPESWLGYVEAETMYVAAPASGRLAARPVERGSAVEQGAPLFSLDPESSDADIARLEAEASAARAGAADLTDPRQRQPDIAAARASVAAAQAQLTRAAADYGRIADLNRRGFASRAQLDAVRAARDAAQAQLAQAQAQVAAGQISAGRSDQIAAARAQARAAEAALRGQRQRRREISPVAPAKGFVEQTFYNVGEWVPANSPVVAVLPDERRKLRFYVPQGQVAGLRPGSTVTFACDGCGNDRQARISYISPRVEFSPPVIYSEHARAKLVFLVEALLPPSDKPLPPGLPVAVTPQ